MAPSSQLVAHVAAGMTDLYLQDMHFAPQQAAVVISPQDTSAWGALPARAERPIYPYSGGSISQDGRVADVQKQTENGVGAGMKTRKGEEKGSDSVLAADAEKQARLKLEQEKVALLMRLKVAETRASESAAEKERLLEEGERVRRQAHEDAERLVRQAKEHEQANLETSRLLQALMEQASRGLMPAAQPLAPAPTSRAPEMLVPAHGAFQGESVTKSEILGAAHREQQEARLRENVGEEPQSAQNISPVDRGVQATIWRSASTQTQATEPLAKETRFEGEVMKSLHHRAGTTLHGTPSKHHNDRRPGLHPHTHHHHHHHRFSSVRLRFRCCIEPCAHLTKKLCGLSGGRGVNVEVGTAAQVPHIHIISAQEGPGKNGVENFWWNSQDVERADEESLGATHWVEDAPCPTDGREQAEQGLVPREVPFLPGHAENRTHKSDNETEAFWRHAQGVHERHALAHSPRRGARGSGFSESAGLGPGVQNPARARSGMTGESQSLEEEEE